MTKFFQILKDKKKLIIKVSCIIGSVVVISGTIVGIHMYQVEKKNRVDASTENESNTETEQETSTEVETTLEIETTEIETTEIETTTEVESPIESETTKETEKDSQQETAELKEEEIQEADIFFENSVFVGDSVMMGFRNYVMRHGNILSNPEFLVSGSFSTRSALQEVSNASIHPIYKGKQHQIQESIKLMEVEKVFVSLGLNDIGMQGTQKTVELYDELIQRIYRSNPEIQIYIISTTYMLIGSEKNDLNNELIREFNGMIKEYCIENEIGYIEIAESLADENGGLAKEYCSDGYVHLTPSAYDIWTRLLREFALEETVGGEEL